MAAQAERSRSETKRLETEKAMAGLKEEKLKLKEEVIAHARGNR